jgi:hypothetical protein
MAEMQLKPNQVTYADLRERAKGLAMWLDVHRNVNGSYACVYAGRYVLRDATDAEVEAFLAGVSTAKRVVIEMLGGK